MTKEERIIATAFTGIMFINGPEMELLYEYMEKKVGYGVFDLMLTSKRFWKELHKACEQDFINMVSKEQPKVDLDDELKNERIILLDAFGPMNGEQSLAIRNFAGHFYELGLSARKEK